MKQPCTFNFRVFWALFSLGRCVVKMHMPETLHSTIPDLHILPACPLYVEWRAFSMPGSWQAQSNWKEYLCWVTLSTLKPNVVQRWVILHSRSPTWSKWDVKRISLKSGKDKKFFQDSEVMMWQCQSSPSQTLSSSQHWSLLPQVLRLIHKLEGDDGEE